jgi:hypothetical protein
MDLRCPEAGLRVAASTFCDHFVPAQFGSLQLRGSIKSETDIRIISIGNAILSRNLPIKFPVNCCWLFDGINQAS